MVSKIFIDYVLQEARAGHLAPLISRVLFGASDLTPDERQLIATLLEPLEGSRGKAELRQIEKMLVASRVEGLVHGEDGEPPMKVEAAVKQVMKERGRSRGFVFEAIKQFTETGSKIPMSVAESKKTK